VFEVTGQDIHRANKKSNNAQTKTMQLKKRKRFCLKIKMDSQTEKSGYLQLYEIKNKYI